MRSILRMMGAAVIAAALIFTGVGCGAGEKKPADAEYNTADGTGAASTDAADTEPDSTEAADIGTGGTGAAPAVRPDQDNSSTAAGEITDKEHFIGSAVEYVSDDELSYAKNFTISRYDDGSVLLSLADGSRILSLPEGADAPEDMPEDIMLYRRGEGRIYVSGSGSMDFFRVLDCLDEVGFCSGKAEDWTMESVRQAMEDGRILYVGKYSDPDYELLMEGDCTLAVENTMIFHAPKTLEKLRELGITVITDQASREDHPLGRVEWIKLYGALLGCDDRAAQAFEEQASQAYDREKTGKKVAFFYIDDTGAVVVRRTDDYISEMIRIAGGEYVFDDLYGDNALSTETIQMEDFYLCAKDADYLIYNGLIPGSVDSVSDIVEKSSLLEEFDAVRNGRVYTVDKDFYQNSMSLGTMISDMALMLEDADGDMVYLRHIN